LPHAALSADDRGGFKSVRQLMEPVIEEMKEAAEAVAAGAEDDGLMLTAVGAVTGALLGSLVQGRWGGQGLLLTASATGCCPPTHRCCC
jgi:hypothetical protein